MDSRLFAPDPEEQAVKKAQLEALPTPILDFNKLAENIRLARLRGPVHYDTQQLLIECLVTEIVRLRSIVEQP